MASRSSEAESVRNELARAVSGWDNEGGTVQPEADGPFTLARLEQRVLQCLGAAVIVRWNDLPTDIQRELFRHAVSMGKERDHARLKEEIARFLHTHKDDRADTA